VILAICLIGVMAAVALPSFASSTVPFRVQSAGREVYGALQEVRQQAITRGKRTRFLVVGTDSYTLQWEDDGTWRTLRGPMQLEQGVSLVSSGGDLTFLPRGTVSPLSTLTISDTEDSNHRLVVSVPITGLVRILEGGG
jgi:Tfp pilus assembly protein FimT